MLFPDQLGASWDFESLLWRNGKCNALIRFSMRLYLIPAKNQAPRREDKMAEKKDVSSPPLTKTPKSQLTAEQPSTKKDWNLPQKDILHPKTKKKPQWDGRRGTLMIKSSPIPARWVTHRLENNHITEVLLQEWEFWAPCQAPQPRGLASGGSAPWAFGFEGHQSLTTGTPQDWV